MRREHSRHSTGDKYMTIMLGDWSALRDVDKTNNHVILAIRMRRAKRYRGKTTAASLWIWFWLKEKSNHSQFYSILSTLNTFRSEVSRASYVFPLQKWPKSIREASVKNNSFNNCIWLVVINMDQRLDILLVAAVMATQVMGLPGVIRIG